MTIPPVSASSSFLIAPPLTPPFRHRGGVSSFGVRRWRGVSPAASGFSRDLPTVHEGVDLQPARPGDEGAVYAAYWGTIVHIGTEKIGANGAVEMETLTLRCDPPASGILFRYLHMLRSVTLPGGITASSGIQEGQEVRDGHLLGFISPYAEDPHLHFEMRVFADTGLTFQDARPLETFPLDLTAILYRFDAERWPRARDEEAYTSWDSGGYARIDRLRLLPWRVRHSNAGVEFHTARLWEVTIEDAPGGGTHQSYLPADGAAMPHETGLANLLGQAFTARHRVRLRGRHSHFFGDRMMIEDVRARAPSE